MGDDTSYGSGEAPQPGTGPTPPAEGAPVSPAPAEGVPPVTSPVEGEEAGNEEAGNESW